jgi:hypothetical protein
VLAAQPTARLLRIALILVPALQTFDVNATACAAAFAGRDQCVLGVLVVVAELAAAAVLLILGYTAYVTRLGLWLSTG